ncbi:MAG TPA: inorganic phosphate transporter, partial [Salinivirgaceae bacterium]|nr:inorganic phosphate transporter [Salinivirgaceae bacterium]
MDNYYLLILIILLFTAFADLIVGVANDAVNFLNSAVGTKVAKGWVILLMGSLGVFFGATFSKGMMEIARSGVFNPQMYTFAAIMSVFIAVMLADVFLLDLFNSLGLPTSTTVSIIFELLGASLAVAIITIYQNPEVGQIKDFINSAKALGMITGILLSVVIAFSVGTLVMYLSRLLFSFNYKKNLSVIGSLFGGFSISMFTYFLILKGLKGASFITPETYELIKSKNIEILGYTFIGSSILLQILYSLFRINPLKIIVLLGTFSLAMAFAGNDLVNFVGVPLAGLDSYIHYRESGLPADSITMEILKQPVQVKTWILLIAGAVMVFTLITSKKAKKVISTSVDLSRQDEGTENFSSSGIGRLMVRFSINMAKSIDKITPKRVSPWIESRFAPYVEIPELDENKKPAFDLVRGSVNLMVASALIALGTS